MTIFRLSVATAIVAAAYFFLPHGIWIAAAVFAGYGLTAACWADKTWLSRRIKKWR